MTLKEKLKNSQILLAKRPKGMPTKENFTFKDNPVPQREEGEVLVKTIYLSVDPYMRGRMDDAKSYVKPFELNEMICGGIIGEVILSDSDQLSVGDKVVGTLGWQRYNVIQESKVRKIDETIAPLTAHLSVLGLTGLTAYFGLLDIGQPKEGETVVVSGAAGAVGMIVGQIAKIKGARVVGIAGSDEKTAYLKQELGFDETINYKTSPNMEQTLEEACPNGIDIYFDNVGGPISDAAINLLNEFARIPLCGAISSYNRTDGDLGPRVQTKLIKSRGLIKGFIIGDYADRFNEGIRDLSSWLAEGKLKYEENIVEGFVNVPEAFLGLFKGENLGKQLIKVDEE